MDMEIEEGCVFGTERRMRRSGCPHRFQHGAFQSAATLAVISCCGAMASGRCISVFYAQAGRSSWMGILLSAVIYGFLMGGIARLKRRSGADSLAGLYTGIMGWHTGALLMMLHGLLYALGMFWIVNSVAHASALMLPLHHADGIGICIALAAGMMAAEWGVRRMRICGSACFLLLTGFALALLLYGRMPGAGELHYHVYLKLEKAPWAAALLALIHASLAAGMCAAPAVKLFPLYLKPSAAGMISAAAFAALLIPGNSVFALFPREIIALGQPFAAISGKWGAAGYYICAALRWLEGAVCIAGICCLLPEKRL